MFDRPRCRNGVAVLVLWALCGAAHADTLAEIHTRGVLVWGADAQGGAPFEFPDPQDPARLIGFEVELADALAAQLGVAARMQQGAWDKLLELLARGDFDLAISGLEATPDKRTVCLMSQPYYVSPERLTIRRGDANAPRTLAALRGRRVGTLPSSAAERILREAGAEVATYEGGQDDVYNDLRLGRTDAVLLDETVSTYFGAVDPRLEVLPESFGQVRYAVAIRTGDTALLRAVDAALATLARDGTLRAIYERWGIWNAETSAIRTPRRAVPRWPGMPGARRSGSSRRSGSASPPPTRSSRAPSPPPRGSRWWCRCSRWRSRSRSAAFSRVRERSHRVRSPRWRSGTSSCSAAHRCSCS
jgi:polar amino acid transport system substrate-binding protein